MGQAPLLPENMYVEEKEAYRLACMFLTRGVNNNNFLYFALLIN